MRGSGISLRAWAFVRYWPAVATPLCVAAMLLFGLAASAQDETPSEAATTEEAADSPTEEAAESSAGETGELPDSGDESEKSRGKELEAFASETEQSFTLEPIQTGDIEEILIHGEAGAGTPKAAPISVIGFDMDTLSKEGIRDIRDLANFTPSLEIKSAFAATNPAIFIRGVGLDDFNANAASAVAIYQDGIYMQSGAIQLFGFFDEENVEVLRGPQGTYYRNASAGAILVRSRAPTEEFEAYISSSYGRFNQFDLTGAISGPIVPDWLTGRIAGYWNTRDGTTKNRCNFLTAVMRPFCRQSVNGKPLISKGVEARVNDVDNYGLRALLLLAPPTLDMEWLVNVHGGQNLGHAYQFQHNGVTVKKPNVNDIAPPEILDTGPTRDANGYVDLDGDPFAGEYDLNGPEDLAIFGSNLTYTWHFGDSYEFESITGYEWHDRYTLENTDASPRISNHTEYEDDAWQLSEELNLRGEWIGSDLGDGGWSMGAFYLQEDLNVRNKYSAIGTDQLQRYEQKLRNFGSYIQGDYTLRPGCAPIGCDFKLDVGLRYNVEYKSFDITSCPLQPDQAECEGIAVSLSGKETETWDGWSGDFILSWFYDDQENNVYLKYSRGWKGGHFNGGVTTRFDIITGVDPEIVDSYELGLRAHWFDGRLMTNVTGFFYDYQDLQVFKLEQSPAAGFAVAKLINSDEAEVYGVELDLAAQPIEGMNITFNAAWVESEYTEFVTLLPFRFRKERPGGRGFFPPITVYFPFEYSGNDLIGSPRFSFTGSIDYEIPLPGEIAGRGLGTLTPRYSFSWKDDIYFDASSGQGPYINFPKAFFGQEAFWIHNASLSWRSENDLIEVTGWVHNFLDQHYKTSSDDFSLGVEYTLDAWADPRTYGISVTIAY